jgi:Tfp pilus assembly protein PilF
VVVDASGTIRWKVRDQRCHLKQIDGGDFSMGFEHRVEGYFGEPVLTNIGLASFLHVFDAMFLALKGQRTIINATQGGARIKGAHQMSLRTALDQHARKILDKALPRSLSGLADDADALIDKVVPLLEEDIGMLRDIYKHAQQGLRSNHKMLITKRWDLVKKLMAANEYHSNKAHELAKRLPLVALAIFGASRRIEYSDLKVEWDGTAKSKEEGLARLENSRKDFETRVKRNRIILEAARDAAKSLKATYEKTLDRLQKYKAGVKDALRPHVPDEKPSLDDAEQYFSEGNWARPLIIARKLFPAVSNPSTQEAEFQQVTSVICRALAMRDAATKEAEVLDEDALIEANELVYDAQALGRDKKEYDTTLEMLERAHALCPQNETALWGLATTYHHTGRIQDALEAYRKLLEVGKSTGAVSRWISRYRFEYGQVLIKAGDIEEGLGQIQKAMEESDEFDSFLWVVGDICRQAGMLEKALLAYDTYLEKFPADYRVMESKIDVLERLERYDEAEAVGRTVMEISGKS